MATPIRTTSQDSTDAIRKRVCKACDRCRLKKSKCDGTSPCSRCRADNAICVFGERKKSHDKVYPKGYVEMLEQQQSQLVTALQEMYHRLGAAQAWTGPTLSEASGHPLTHDILSALDLLESKHDGSGEMEVFEEDCSKLQSRLLAQGAGYVHRRGSLSSDSEHSHQEQPRKSPHGTPTEYKPPVFRESFALNSATSSPLIQSPAPRVRQTLPVTQSPPLQQGSPLTADPQFYQAEWAIPDMSNSEVIMQSKFAMQAPDLHQRLSNIDNLMTDDQFEAPQADFDANFGSLPFNSYSQEFSNAMPGNLQDFGLGVMNPMELEWSNYLAVPVAT